MGPPECAVRVKSPCGARAFQNADPFKPSDFKSLVSTDFTIPALVRWIWYHIFMIQSSYNWSIFSVNASRQLSINQFNSAMSMAFIAFMVCSAAESNSVLPAFCSSIHLI